MAPRYKVQLDQLESDEEKRDKVISRSSPFLLVHATVPAACFAQQQQTSHTYKAHMTNHPPLYRQTTRHLLNKKLKYHPAVCELQSELVMWKDAYKVRATLPRQNQHDDQVQQHLGTFVPRNNVSYPTPQGLSDIGATLFAPLQVKEIAIESVTRKNGEDHNPMETAKQAPPPSVPFVNPSITASSQHVLVNKSVCVNELVPSNSCSTGEQKLLKILTTLGCDHHEDDREQYGRNDGYDNDDDVDFIRMLGENPDDILHCPPIMTGAMKQQIQEEGLPHRLLDNRWERCFAIGRDGDSFCGMISRCQAYQETILILRTTRGHILGGYASERWGAPWSTASTGSWSSASPAANSIRSNSYYGTGLSFLFGTHPACNALGHHNSKAKESNKGPLNLYRWTGLNDYNQVCDLEDCTVAMGGDGDFGLLIRDDFTRGITGPCATFGNPPLVPNWDGTFEIESFEVYGIVPMLYCFQHQSFSPLRQSTWMRSVTCASDSKDQSASDSSRLSFA
jgi:hypothetical protein